MTRKDYIAIAKVISSEDVGVYNGQDGAVGYLFKADTIHGLANVMAADNPRFDRDKFIAACYVN